MSLSAEHVARLFKRLTVVYGYAFLRQYDGVDMADVHADWADVLSGLDADRSRALLFGLENLPTRPVTAREFRAICMRCPEPATRRLPPPATDPLAVRQALELARRAMAGSASGGRAWAERLREQEQQGAPLTVAQRQAWRAALGETRS